MVQTLMTTRKRNISKRLGVHFNLLRLRLSFSGEYRYIFAIIVYQRGRLNTT
jgi:hypothetical protein